MDDQRRGFLLGVAAYAMWGAFPLYWPHLQPAGALEILAHRILWSMLTMGLLVVLARRTTQLRAILRDRRTTGLLVLAAATVTVNWATYIWGVNHGRVVETSLGYFVNPLVTVLMAVVVLGEKLRPLQWAALGLATGAVGVLTIDYGRPPYVALVLAFSFGSYGLLKKTADVGAVESVMIETTAVAPLAAVYLVVLGLTGGAHFVSAGTGHALLLASSGLVTAIPLICFGGAATRVSLVTLGLLQYLAPIFQFGLGVFYFHEQMTPGRWAGFALVWVALIVFTLEATTHHRRQLSLAAVASAA